MICPEPQVCHKVFFLLEPCILYVQQDVLGGVSVHIGDLLAWVLYTSHLTCMGNGEWGLAMALAVDNRSWGLHCCATLCLFPCVHSTLHNKPLVVLGFSITVFTYTSR